MMENKPLTFRQYFWKETKWMWLAFAFIEALSINALAHDDAPSFLAGTALVIFLIIFLIIGEWISYKKYLKRI